MTDSQPLSDPSRSTGPKLPRRRASGQAGETEPGGRARRAGRRALIVGLEIVAAVLAGAVILAGLAMWRLSQGPVEATFLTPFIEDALNRPDSPVAVRVGDTVVTWEGWGGALEVKALDVEVLDGPRGARVVLLPELTIGLSLTGLGGGVALTALRLTDARITLSRDADGAFSLLLAPDQGADATDALVGGDGETLLQAILRPPSGDGAAGQLRRFQVANATIFFRDAGTGMTLVGENGNLAIDRDGAGITASLAARVTAQGEISEISALAVKGFADRDVAVTVGFSNLRPGLIAGLDPRLSGLEALDLGLTGNIRLAAPAGGRPERISFDVSSEAGMLAGSVALAPGSADIAGDATITGLSPPVLARAFAPLERLAGLRAPVDGTLTFAGRADTGAGALEADLRIGAGRVVVADVWPEPVAIQGARLAGAVFDLGREAHLDRLSIELEEGLTVEAAGALSRVEGGRRLTLEGVGRGMDAARLAEYWPPGLAVNARDWVTENITAGFVEEATVSLGVDLPENGFDGLALSDLGGVIRFRDAEAHYLRPLPPAVGLEGTATYGNGWIIIEGGGGSVLDAELRRGRVEIQDIGGADDTTIDVSLSGPLSSAIELLDNERLGLITRLGLDVEGLAGRADTELSLRLPLKLSIRFDDVEVSARATVRDLVQPAGPLGLAVAAEAVALEVDKAGLSVSGPVRLNGVPLDLEWRERFSDAEAWRSRYMLSGAVGVADLAAFGLDPPDALDGALRGRLVYGAYRDGGQSLEISADAAEAGLSVPEIALTKPIGAPAELTVSARWREGGSVGLDRFALVGQDIDIRANGVLEPGFAGVREIEIERAAFPGTDVSGALAARPEGGYRIGLTGPRLDLSGLLGDAGPGVDVAPDADAPARPAVAVNLAVGSLFLGQGQSLAAVRAEAVRDGADIQRLVLDARTGEAGDLAIRYLPDGPGHSLQVDASDAGEALGALDWTSRIEGGAMALTGRRAGPGEALTGTVLMENFTLVDAPAMVKLLEFVSLTGALTAFQQSGLAFQQLEAEFGYLEGRLTVPRGRAFGPSIGITFEGTVDLPGDTVDMRGAVVPAYTFNRILGEIPIIGWLITGGQDEGLFAANYAIEGPLEDPNVGVNPLSALAPGFLRAILGLEADPNAPPVERPDDNLRE